MTIIGLLLFLIVSAVCAWIAEAVVPGQVPGGFFVSAIVGVIGAWIGTNLMGHIGPDLAGVPLISAIIGSAIFVFLLAALSRAIGHSHG